MHHCTGARHCGAFQTSFENSLVPGEPSAMAAGKGKRAGRELLAGRDSVWESFAIVLSCVQMFFFQQTLGTITAVPIKVPQVSSLQRLAGQGPAVLPQVQNTVSRRGFVSFLSYSLLLSSAQAWVHQHTDFAELWFFSVHEKILLGA